MFAILHFSAVKKPLADHRLSRLDRAFVKLASHRRSDKPNASGGACGRRQSRRLRISAGGFAVCRL
jgi:hypothetical protein